MKEKMYRFLKGRNGADQLTKFLLYISLALLLIGTIFDITLINIASLIIILYSNFRVFSRNIIKRVEENQKFLSNTRNIRNFLVKYRNRIFGKEGYKYFQCKSCNQELRVPKGKGVINVRCPKCNTIKKVKS